MNGDLAQQVALASHGSTWLRDGGPIPAALHLTGSTFTFTDWVHFRFPRLGVRQPELEVADVDGWLGELKRRETERIWLVVRPPRVLANGSDERMLAGFVGGGTWSLLATGGRPAVGWVGQGAVGDQNDPDRRTWRTTYVGLDVPGRQPAKPALTESSNRLRGALDGARDFAARVGDSRWSDVFAEALTAEDVTYYGDVLSTAMTAAARCLAAQASAGMVFGGMGSWNDIDFADPTLRAEYDAVSRELHSAALQGLVAAVNADLA